VYDVSGAGDTVLAVLGVGLGGGLALEEAARLSNVAAGIVVGKVGTSTVTPEEILEVVGRQHQDTDLKIKQRDALKVLMDDRRSGARPLFHQRLLRPASVGHVKYLQKARQLGTCWCWDLTRMPRSAASRGRSGR
jgi:D-beta-D-heptose 7-phosphate kinase/D-beta-D-heptose 1-phosphate adenosyltransferase